MDNSMNGMENITAKPVMVEKEKESVIGATAPQYKQVRAGDMLMLLLLM